MHNGWREERNVNDYWPSLLLTIMNRYQIKKCIAWVELLLTFPANISPFSNFYQNTGNEFDSIQFPRFPPRRPFTCLQSFPTTNKSLLFRSSMSVSVLHPNHTYSLSKESLFLFNQEDPKHTLNRRRRRSQRSIILQFTFFRHNYHHHHHLRKEGADYRVNSPRTGPLSICCSLIPASRISAVGCGSNIFSCQRKPHCVYPVQY